MAAEPPLKPLLQKPPGYKDPNAPAYPVPRPPPRKANLPPSFHPKKERRSFCRFCCCCLCIFLLMLILIVLIFGAFFYLWFDPKLPSFHLQSFRINRFNVTNKPDGTYITAETVGRVEVRNPNEKLTYYYDKTYVGVSVGTGDDETDLGSTSLDRFTQGKDDTTSLKVETKVANQLVDDSTGSRLMSRFTSKALAVNVEARTKVGVGTAGLKLGMLGVTVKCAGNALKQLNGENMPKCVVNILRWINIH